MVFENNKQAMSGMISLNTSDSISYEWQKHIYLDL